MAPTDCSDLDQKLTLSLDSLSTASLDYAAASTHTKPIPSKKEWSNRSSVDFELDLPNSNSTVKLNRTLVLICLYLTVFIGSIDTTILTTSLTQSTSKFNLTSSTVVYLTIAYLLTSTSMQPIYGKLVTTFTGCQLLFSLVSIYSISLVGCGFANSAGLLIFFRFLGGLGGGGLYPISIILLSELIAIRSRGLYLSLASLIYFLANFLGPILTGLMVNRINSQYNVAYLFLLPICVLDLVLIYFGLGYHNRNGTNSYQSFKKKVSQFDWVGSLTLFTFTCLLILSLTWSGDSQVGFTNPKSLSVFSLCIICLITFVTIEVKFTDNKDKLLAKGCLNRNTVLLNINSFLTGGILSVLTYYLPLFYQTLANQPPTEANLKLLPLLLSSVLFGIVGGVLMAKTKLYYTLSYLGTGVQLLGCIMLTVVFRNDVSDYKIVLSLILIGMGSGLNFQNNTVIVQNSVANKYLASSTSLLYFTNMLGGLISLSLQGSIFNSTLQDKLIKLIPQLATNQNLLVPVNSLLNLVNPNDVQEVVEIYCHSFKLLFITLVPYAALALICLFGLKRLPLKV